MKHEVVEFWLFVFEIEFRKGYFGIVKADKIWFRGQTACYFCGTESFC